MAFKKDIEFPEDVVCPAPNASLKTQFTKLNKIEKRQRNSWNRLNMFMSNMIELSWNNYFQYGFEVLGPILFGFCKWLRRITKERKFERIFFLSRDGYLLLKAYTEIFPLEETPISYLYVSRKVVREAQLWMRSELSDVSWLFPQNTYLQCGEFCRYFNICPDEVIDVLMDCGLSEDTRFLPRELRQDVRLVNFYERIRPKIIEKSKASYFKIVQYLHQNQFYGNIGIVDIGWKGTIQNCLEMIIQNDMDNAREITGCYLGLTRDAAEKENKLSFIASDEEPQEFDAGFVEYPFLAPEGSLIGYTVAPDNTVLPVLADYEYDRESHEIAKSMQDGAIYFIKCAKELAPGDFTWDAQFVYANLKRISKHPTLREVNVFGDLAYYDGGRRQIAAPKGMGHYLLHIKDFPYDLSISGWRIAFLKRMFKIDLDYNKLLKIYKSHVKCGDGGASKGESGQ